MSESSAAQPTGVAVADGRPLLELRTLTMRFGGVVALNGVELSVREGEIFALIGPNGAGKTTVFNVVTGVYQPSEGEIWFDGGRISGKKRYAVTKLGVARTFQNVRLFHNMTALENVMVGADAHHRTGLAGAALGLPWHRKEERDGRALAAELLEFVGIPRRQEESAKNLPYGGPAPAGRSPAPSATRRRPAARRARRRNEPGGEVRTHAGHPPHPRPFRRRRSADRARHEAGDRRLRADHGPGPRRNHCSRHSPTRFSGTRKVIEAYLGEPA